MFFEVVNKDVNSTKEPSQVTQCDTESTSDSAIKMSSSGKLESLQNPKSTDESWEDASRARSDENHDMDEDDHEIFDNVGGKIDPNIPNGGWKAWSQVLGSWCAVVMTFGIASGTGTLNPWLRTHQLSHRDPSEVGWMFSIQMFIMYFGGIQVGPVFDAYGLRCLLIPGCIGFTVAIFVLSVCKEYYQFILCYSILGGLSSMLIFNPSITVLTHWFSTRRGIAIGIASTGSAIGGIIFPQLLSHLLPRIGYGWAVRCMAFIVLFLAIISCCTLNSRHRRPSINWNDAKPELSVLLQKEFAACVIGLFLVEWAIKVPIQYIVSYALSQGMTANQGSNLLAYMNTASCVSRICTGFFADKLGNFNAMIVASALAGIMCLCVWLPGGHSQAGLITFTVFYGIFGGAVIALTLIVVPSLAQVKNSGRRFGTAYMIASFAVLTGIPIAGALNGHHYLGAILFTGVVYIVGALAFFCCRYWAAGWKSIF